MYAAKGNHPHTCQELLGQSANFALVNLDDDTALSIAVDSNSTSGKRKVECRLDSYPKVSSWFVAQVVIENHIIMYIENGQSTKED